MTQIVILAAGASSRFFPFSEKTHKTMFSVCGKPLLGWTLEGLSSAGFKDVVVVLSKEDEMAREYLSGKVGLGIKIAYQDKPLGMGDALLSAKEYLKDEFIVGFGHFVDSDAFVLLDKKASEKTAVIVADETDEPWKYGILELKKNQVIGIVEKPPKGKERSNIRAAGLYLLNQKYVKQLEASEVSQYNFESVLDEFVRDENVEILKLDKPLFSLKYPWDLFEIKNFLLDNLPEKKAKSASVAPTATLKGKVIIEEGAKIFDYALVEGPVYIGKNAVVGAYSVLRNYSTLEESAEIQRYADVTRSIFGPNSHIHSGFVGDSILGRDIRIGAGFITANRRVDRADIDVEVKGDKVTSGSSYLGALVGDEVKIGINVSTMPGVVLGAASRIGPNTSVMQNVPSKTLVYSEEKTVRKSIK